jgi:NTP pyrophosphatase (non-canonical NTP hydrolase)
MLDLAAIQKRVYANKLAQGFNVTDVPLEFAYAYGELAEAFEAWRKKKDSTGEEIADVTIYLLGLCEILGVDLERELLAKMDKNEKRCYETDER